MSELELEAIARIRELSQISTRVLEGYYSHDSEARYLIGQIHIRWPVHVLAEVLSERTDYYAPEDELSW
jgi:hypothetical protein